MRKERSADQILEQLTKLQYQMKEAGIGIVPPFFISAMELEMLRRYTTKEIVYDGTVNSPFVGSFGKIKLMLD